MDDVFGIIFVQKFAFHKSKVLSNEAKTVIELTIREIGRCLFRAFPLRRHRTQGDTRQDHDRRQLASNSRRTRRCSHLLRVCPDGDSRCELLPVMPKPSGRCRECVAETFLGL